MTRKLFGVDIDDKSYIERIEQAQCSRMSSIFKNQSKDVDDVVPSDKKRELLQAKMEKLRLLVTKNRVKNRIISSSNMNKPCSISKLRVHDNSNTVIN